MRETTRVTRSLGVAGAAAHASHAIPRTSGTRPSIDGIFRAALPFSLLLLGGGLGSVSDDAGARLLHGNPDTYRMLLAQLLPGDELELGPGEYDGLPIRDLHGRTDAPITVSGHPDKTVIVGKS